MIQVYYTSVNQQTCTVATPRPLDNLEHFLYILQLECETLDLGVLPPPVSL